MGPMNIARLVTAVLCGAALAAGATPADNPEDAWITVNGTVVSADDGAFVLDYGTGLITVEMDGWGWYEESREILEGDDVTVHGRVDDGLFEQRTIEAGSVYVDDLKTYFHANPADEEGDAGQVVAYTVARALPEGSRVRVTGIVKDIEGRELVLGAGPAEIRVDTWAMTYNPLDDRGFQQLDRGDVVTVVGALDAGLFERREIVADYVYSITQDKARQEANMAAAGD